MKTIITKFFAIALSVLLLSSSYSFAETFNVGATAVTAVYDYSSFSSMGSFSSVANLASGTETRVYANASVTGFQNDSNEFIAQQVSKRNAAGVTVETRDFINGTVQTFSETGTLTRAYTEIDLNADGVIGEGETYEAAIAVDANTGSYTITWTGRMLKDSTDQDSGYVTGTTSVESYSVNGRLLTTTSYKVNADGTGTEAGSISVNTYDAAGNIASVTSYSGADTSTEKLSVTTYEFGQRSYVTSFKDGGSYVSARYNYDGNKLVSITGYEIKDANSAINDSNTKVSQTTFFDEHSRVSYTTDGTDRVTSHYNYNDTLTPVTNTVNGQTFVCVPGGLIFRSTVTYKSETENGYKEDRTYYINGSQNFPGVTFTYHTDLEATTPNVWTTWGDPTVTGTVGNTAADGSGNTTLTVTTEAGYNAMIAGLNEALYGVGGTEANPKEGSAQYWANRNGGDNTTNVTRLNRLKSALAAQWNANGKITLFVGAITQSSLLQNSGANANTGHASSVAYSSVENATLMAQIQGMSGSQATLTWDYWSMDDAGNIWAFANAATQS